MTEQTLERTPQTAAPTVTPAEQEIARSIELTAALAGVVAHVRADAAHAPEEYLAQSIVPEGGE